jgi:septal ring factor EnvC (AmiA/AmiB activator)
VPVKKKKVVKTSYADKKPTKKTDSYSSGKISKKAFLIPPLKVPVLYKFGEDVNGIRNDGLSYRADKDSKVRAASDGDVVYVDRESGLVIIEHSDDFYTVYSGMDEISVKMGDRSSSGSNIGSLKKESILYFELRRLQENTNPRAMNPELYFL